MSEMIERVAAAIADAEGSSTQYAAECAIRAMREPTAAMIEAGMTEAEVDLASEYRAMIDAALRSPANTAPLPSAGG